MAGLIEYSLENNRGGVQPVGPSTPLPVTGVGSAASLASPQYVTQGALTAGTNRSGTATTTSGGLSVAANTSRRFLVGQNIGANVIGFNEFGGTAAIGTAGTYTVQPGASFSISTTNLVNFIAATGDTAVSMTEG